MFARVNRLAIVIAAIAAALGISVGMIAGYAIWGSQSSTPTTQEVTVRITEQSAPRAVQLVSGEENGQYERTYGCAGGYTTADVPVGRVSTVNGTTLEVREDRTDYGYQNSVTFNVTLGNGAELGGVIIVSAANVRRPDLYPQYKLDLPVVANGIATATVQSVPYAPNYREEGINNLRFCLR
jgi:hypothetical protein